MASAMSWAFLLFAVAACSALPQDERIVGGESTTIQSYPSIVQVDYQSSGIWSQSCAGSILTTTVVVSAAHCFTGASFTPTTRRIRAGTTNRNTGGDVVYLSSVLNHPGFTSLSYDNDISLLKLSSPLSFSNSIQSVTIIAQGIELPDNLPIIHAGWGTTSQNGSPSPVLLDVTIFTVNRQVCAQRYSTIWGTITDNMICAGILDVGGKDACEGDSGGPLYYDNILVGIDSWGAGCAQAYFPGVSTRVSSYTNWIIDNA